MTCSACEKPIFRRDLCAMHYSRILRRGELEPAPKKAANGSIAAWIEAHKNHSSHECLPWPFATFSNGYGVVNDDPRGRVASRVMCHAAWGAPPSEGYEAAHSCGKGHLGCVNPAHLSWATPVANQADKHLHGTLNDGARNGGAKLSEGEVLNVLQCAEEGTSAAEIARRFFVSVSTVRRIIKGQSWRTCQSNFRAMGKVA